jgi:hypothetical protein
MIDVNTYLAAQQIMRDLTHSARPDAPVQPDRTPVARHLDLLARHHLSRLVRCLTQIIQPNEPVTTGPLPGSRSGRPARTTIRRRPQRWSSPRRGHA